MEIRKAVLKQIKKKIKQLSNIKVVDVILFGLQTSGTSEFDSDYEQIISNKRTDFQADRVLLLKLVTEKKEKVHLSHFLKFLFTNRTNGTVGFARYTSQPFTKPKELFFATVPRIMTILTVLKTIINNKTIQ